jgi:glucose dehydrogenase
MPRRILRSAGLYPITTVYVSGVALIMSAVMDFTSIPASIIIFGVVALLAVVWAALRELRAVHILVDGQRHELIARIDQLTAIILEMGVVMPAAGPKEQDARDDLRREARTG